ncbi:MAG: hypothetical protein AB4372_12165 [Xenococcus sp. (in: cyanobacteria)]
MKKFLPNDEQDLVSFLRQHRPIAPKQTPHLENQVMDLVNQTSQRNSQEKHSTLITFFSGMLAVIIAVIWNSSRWNEQTPQIAIDQDIIETFLINSWENTIHEQTILFSDQQEADWFYSNIEETSHVFSHSQ